MNYNLLSLNNQFLIFRLARNNDAMKTALKSYDESLEQYIPVLMAQAKIYWDRENYPQVGGKKRKEKRREKEMR